MEKKWRKIAKKSIYLSKNIKSGKKIKFSDLVIRRPAGKSEPIDIYEICKKNFLSARDGRVRVSFCPKNVFFAKNMPKTG